MSAHIMGDDKTKKDYRDKTRINMNEPYEVAYFKKKFGCPVRLWPARLCKKGG